MSDATPIADSQRIWLAVQKEREWQQTPLGAAFRKFESATQRYWQQDGNDHISNKRLTELDDACRKARAEFLILLRGW